MSGEKDLEQLKREAAEKAKAAALAKKQAMQAGGTAPQPSAEPPKAEDPADAKKAAAAAAKAAALAKKAAQDAPAQVEAGDDDDLAKKKAAAAAKAKAAAAAKAKATGAEAAESPAAGGDDAKAKAAAAAKAKAAAAAAAKAKAQREGGAEAGGDDEKAKAVAAAKAKAAAAAAAKRKAGGADAGGDDEKAKAVAAAKAKAAAAAAAKKKDAAGGASAEAPAAAEEVSPNQPYLDKYRKVIAENLGADVLEDSYINKLSNDVPTLVAKRDTYFKLAQFLKYNELLSFETLSLLHGTDFETHMEIYAHLYSFKNRQSVALRVKIDRDQPTIESLVPIWPGANWPECETYDLLGVKFTEHPDLHRIMLGEDWVGYPLRKDYKPHDVEV